MHLVAAALKHKTEFDPVSAFTIVYPALADLRDEYSPLIAECSGVMARLVWARKQPMVSRYIIACLDRMSC